MNAKFLNFLISFFSILIIAGCASKSPAPVEGKIDYEKKKMKGLMLNPKLNAPMCI